MSYFRGLVLRGGVRGQAEAGRKVQGHQRDELHPPQDLPGRHGGQRGLPQQDPGEPRVEGQGYRLRYNRSEQTDIYGGKQGVSIEIYV